MTPNAQGTSAIIGGYQNNCVGAQDQSLSGSSMNGTLLQTQLADGGSSQVTLGYSTQTVLPRTASSGSSAARQYARMTPGEGESFLEDGTVLGASVVATVPPKISKGDDAELATVGAEAGVSEQDTTGILGAALLETRQGDAATTITAGGERDPSSIVGGSGGSSSSNPLENYRPKYEESPAISLPIGTSTNFDAIKEQQQRLEDINSDRGAQRTELVLPDAATELVLPRTGADHRLLSNQDHVENGQALESTRIEEKGGLSQTRNNTVLGGSVLGGTTTELQSGGGGGALDGTTLVGLGARNASEATALSGTVLGGTQLGGTQIASTTVIVERSVEAVERSEEAPSALRPAPVNEKQKLEDQTALENTLLSPPTPVNGMSSTTLQNATLQNTQLVDAEDLAEDLETTRAVAVEVDTTAQALTITSPAGRDLLDTTPTGIRTLEPASAIATSFSQAPAAGRNPMLDSVASSARGFFGNVSTILAVDATALPEDNTSVDFGSPTLPNIDDTRVAAMDDSQAALDDTRAAINVVPADLTVDGTRLEATVLDGTRMGTASSNTVIEEPSKASDNTKVEGTIIKQDTKAEGSEGLTRKIPGEASSVSRRTSLIAAKEDDYTYSSDEFEFEDDDSPMSQASPAKTTEDNKKAIFPSRAAPVAASVPTGAGERAVGEKAVTEIPTATAPADSSTVGAKLPDPPAPAKASEPVPKLAGKTQFLEENDSSSGAEIEVDDSSDDDLGDLLRNIKDSPVSAPEDKTTKQASAAASAGAQDLTDGNVDTMIAEELSKAQIGEDISM
ncbi:unnamed protein product [Amoebophrya sp. A25]|nr:unnamed protein product [Amoebophrya sp. A25]|eukprot:GSA25T00026283001.1